MFALETARLDAARLQPATGEPAPAPKSAAKGGHKRWRLRSSPFIGRLAHAGLPALVARVLEVRGVGSAREAQIFLGGRDLPARDPFLIPGFEAAVVRLRRALREREQVAVYGDFDVDGVTSTATLTETLNDLGGIARPYIPHREREGYGLNLAAVDHLAREGAKVILTCDCGTGSVAEVERARALGLEVVVVDHHLAPARLPAAAALLNPKLRESEYPFADYATAGLAFRLAAALYEASGRTFPEGRYLDLATLGTIADMVPLLDENRDIVRRGLPAIGASTRPGLQALMAVADVQPDSVSAQGVSFALAPRLNAAGRLDDAQTALELLVTRDEERAGVLARRIDALNRERQRLTREAQARALEMFATKLALSQADGTELPIAVVGDAGFHKGIVGLVASRLVEVYGRPAAVYEIGESESRGSCRSIAAYDIVAGLSSCADLFERFGGHRQAAGFTLRNERLREFEVRVVEHASAALAGHVLGPSIDIDAEWPLAAVRSPEIRFLAKLGPHGAGNPEVTLLSRHVTVAEAWAVGDEGRHLRLRLKDGNVTWPAIAFDWAAQAPAAGSLVDVVYGLSADRYGPSYDGNGGALQLTVEDLAVVEGG